MKFIASAIVSGAIFEIFKILAQKSMTKMVLTIDMLLNSLPPYAKVDTDICQDLIDQVNRVEGEQAKKDFIEKTLNEDNKYTEAFEHGMYLTNFAKRMDYLLTKINEDADEYDKKWNIENLGDFLGLESVNELKKHYITSEEPTYAFIEMIAEKIGVNPEWLKAGEGEIFRIEFSEPPGEDWFQCSKDTDVKYFLATRKIEKKFLLLIRKLDDIHFDYYPKKFIFFLSPGCAGRTRLKEEYELLKKLKQEQKLPDDVILLSDEKYYGIQSGKVYPGIVQRQRDKISDMMYDFMNYMEMNRENYLRDYGEEFVNMHEYIERELKREGINN